MSIFSISSSKCTPVFGGGLFEGVKIHHHHIDRSNAMFHNRRPVRSVVSAVTDAAVDSGMQSLHPAIRNLREAVRSEISCTLMPASRSNFAVPPVETSSTPRLASC